MTKPKSTTHVLMIADMSGSMAGLEADVRGGFNTYVKDLKGKPGDYRLTMVVFDTRVQRICLDATLDKVPKLTSENYAPRGMTALLDALGRTTTEFERRVKLRKADRVLCVVNTDGHENASIEWTRAQINDLIKCREGGGQWGFMYLGAGTDTWSQASSMGFQRHGYVNTVASGTGTRNTYSGLTGGTIAFAAGHGINSSTQIVRDTPGVNAEDNGQ